MMQAAVEARAGVVLPVQRVNGYRALEAMESGHGQGIEKGWRYFGFKDRTSLTGRGA